MRDAPSPHLHVFVCTNRREGSPLGPGCGARGDEVYEGLKAEVAARGDVARIWITRTACLGICPKRGTTVARYRRDGATAGPIVTEVGPTDIGALLSERGSERDADAPSARSQTQGQDSPLADLAREIAALEELQRKKVLDLARRLKPGLTLEDVQNPHDFPELDDPDWHYADGVLAGIASVKSTIAALRRGILPRDEEEGALSLDEERGT